MTERGPLGGPAGWALRRYELACERAEPADQLTDVLLALRAMIAPGADAPLLPARVAALVAAPEQWGTVRDRVHMAAGLELAAMSGDESSGEAIRRLASVLRGDLRRLLRDIACGHLVENLATLADATLAREDEALAEVSLV